MFCSDSLGSGYAVQMGLDQTQLKFVNSDSDFVRLIAPAGAGKTHSLLQRCARRANDQPNDRFLIFAFTKAARNELVARVQTDETLNKVSSSITVMTLNAWGNRLLRSHSPKARLIANNFDKKLVLDNSLQPVWTKYPSISKALLDRKQAKAGRAILEAMDVLKSLGFRHEKIEDIEIQGQVDWLIELGLEPTLNQLIDSLEEFSILDSKLGFTNALAKEFLPFWAEATEALNAQGFYSFEDQKYRSLLWIEGQIARGETWSGAARTAHIIVDEFQDINPLDLSLIKALQKINNATLTIVGDDDQAIFEWRGSSPDFILEPDKHFEKTFETFILETNYRSPANIVEISQKLISNNIRRVEKNIKAHSKTNACIDVRDYKNVATCVTETTEFVQELMRNPNISSIALISRKRSQILPYQITFASEDLPFYAAEDLNLGLSKAFEELQLLLGIRSLAVESKLPFGLSASELIVKLVDKVRVYPLNKGDRTELVKYLKSEKPSNLLDAVASLRRYTGPLKGSNTDALNSIEFADSIQNLFDSETVSQALRSISSGFMGLQKDWGRSKDDIYYSDPPFYYLAAMAEPYGNDFEKFHNDIKSALDKLAQVPEDDGTDDSFDKNQVESKLHLMTALRSKGREFDVVVVLDSNDDIWPIRLAKSETELEQERRLFYVATTRAKQELRYVYSYHLLDEKEESSAEAALQDIAVDELPGLISRKKPNEYVSMLPSRYLGEMGLIS